MKKRLFTLGAALALGAKPFLLGSIATAAGMTDSGGFQSSFLRYLVAPQAAAAICLFFLYLDPARYAPFRPLAAVLQALAVSTGIFTAFRAFGAADFAYLSAGDLVSAVGSGFAILLMDLLGFMAALTARAAPREPEASPPTKES